MPLPADDTPWPPAETDRHRDLMDTWGAWYSGDPGLLAHAYGSATSYGPYGLAPRPRPSTYRGGVVGAVARFFWGTPPGDAHRPARLHIPLAGDIAAVNADLLFGEAPTLIVGEPGQEKATQERLDYLLTEGGLHSVLLEGGETASAYGGVYLRATWNTEIADHAFSEAIAPDCAVPEFMAGRLRAVTFWRRLDDPATDGTDMVWRHLERHEVRGGNGVVIHGLYKGSGQSLGQRQHLRERPETEAFAAGADHDGLIVTGASKIAVDYIPNMLPHRLIRGAAQGRSDYQGVEGAMDALDEAWSSWMRDLRLGKARIMIPESFMHTEGRGKGANWDPEQEAFVGVKALPGPNESSSQMITPIQFAIRVAEHSQTCQELTEQVVRGAGFSAQTFGESGDLAITATEVQHRERRTYSTRSRKLGYWTPGLTRHAQTLLEIDAHVFPGNGVRVAPVSVDWPDGVQDSPEQVATTADLLARARAASTESLVRMVHPEWDDGEVQAEVGLIRDDQMQTDPLVLRSLGVGGPEPDDGADPKTKEPGDQEPPGKEKSPASATPGRAGGLGRSAS